MKRNTVILSILIFALVGWRISRYINQTESGIDIRPATDSSKVAPTNSPPSQSSPENLLVVRLYNLFKKISPTDSVTHVLLQDGKISIGHEDMTSTTTLAFNDDKSAMRFENTESGNSSFIVDEYRAVNASVHVKFIHSQFVGTPAFIDQGEFEVFDYDPATGTFKPDAESNKLFEVSAKDFYVDSTPDSVVASDANSSDHLFHIVYVDSGVAENIMAGSLAKQIAKKRLKGTKIRFDFKNDKFVRSQPYFN